MARPVAEAWHHYTDFTNLAPLTNRNALGSQREAVRSRLASLVRCSPEEIALTRNTTEGLNIVSAGLRLSRGDEIVATTHEYPNAMYALRQRAARDGVTLRLVELPIAPASSNAVVETVRRALSSRTRLLLTPHVVDPTGQLLPIGKLAELARAQSVPYLVDGALGFGTAAVDLPAIGCDFYATSLHKGLRPVGNGFSLCEGRSNRLHVAAVCLAGSGKRRYPQVRGVGTQPLAQIAALIQALDFHAAIGIDRVQARLHWLKRYWTERVRQLPGVRFHTSLDAGQSVAIALMEIDGIDPRKLYEHLLAKDRIRAWPIVRPDVRGLWVRRSRTPSLMSSTGWWKPSRA